MAYADLESINERSAGEARSARAPAGGGPDPLWDAGYEVRLSEAPDDPEWDAFLAETPGGYHVQTSRWARVKAVLGWRAARLVVLRGGRIVAGAQLLLRPLPLAGAIGYVPRGPLAAVDDPGLTRLMLATVQRVARAHRVQYLIVQPPRTGEAFAHELPAWGFRPTALELAPTATVVIDLIPELDELLARMRKKTRQHIRNSVRQGITISEGAEGDLHTFYRLHVETSRRQKFSPYPEEYYSEMWHVLRRHDNIRLFLAKHEDEVIAALLVIPFGDTVFTKAIGWSGHHGKRLPNEALYWSVIGWAKSEGYRYCDLEGLDPDAARSIVRGEPLPEPLMQTPAFFKLGLGGQVMLFPGAYDCVYNSFLRLAYRAVGPTIVSSAVVQNALNRRSG